MFNSYNLSTIYVSQKSGSNFWTGFYPEKTDNLSGPLKTIEEALERIAQMRMSGALQPISIVITDDEYNINKPIIIDERISDVTITSLYEKTLVSGGVKIENFKDDVYNGQKCLSAQVPGIEDGFWFTDFYVDDKRADFTYYPKEGLLHPETVENLSSKLFASSKWFIAKKEDVKKIKDFKNFGDCFISYNHYWVDEHTPIEDYDLETGKIVFKYPSRFTIELTHPASALEYRIENVSECFCNKNEWYLDRSTKRVYYIPRNEFQTAENIKAYAPVTDKLFVVQGKPQENVCNIRFENLVFSNTKGDYRSVFSAAEGGVYYLDPECEGYASDIQSLCWANGSIEFYYAHNCFVENCVMKNIGVHAITVNNGCSRISINDNDISDIGAGAVKVNGGEFGCEKTEETYGNIIKNNMITECGKRYFAACGILIMHSYENTIANNDISYLYYTGISVGWVWAYGDNIARDNLIEKNYIHHIGQGKLSDMGGVYLLGKQPGTIVRNNIIHDVESAHYGGWALYTDEGSSYITIENNICYNTSGNVYHQHYGRMNTVRNNIFAKSKNEPVAMSRPELHTGIVFERNIIVSDNTAIYRTGWETDREAAANTYMLCANRNLVYNVSEETYCFLVNGKKYDVKETNNTFGIDAGSLAANPEFQDYENNDYTLLDTSPALKLGFKKIKTDDVGCKR